MDSINKKQRILEYKSAMAAENSWKTTGCPHGANYTAILKYTGIWWSALSRPRWSAPVIKIRKHPHGAKIYMSVLETIDSPCFTELTMIFTDYDHFHKYMTQRGHKFITKRKNVILYYLERTAKELASSPTV